MRAASEKRMPEDLSGKAQPDTAPLDAGLAMSRAEEKVELDLDDAPFLIPEVETPPPPPKAETSLSLDAPEEKPAKKSLFANRKLLIMLVAVVLLLGGGGGATWWFVLRTPPEKAAGPKTVVVPSEPAPAEVPKASTPVVSLEPFWVEQRDMDGQIRFLVCKFAAPATDPKLIHEIQGKKVVIRDAVYYYLKNKSLVFLTDGANAETLKKDLLTIINGYLSLGKLEDLLIENYLVK